MALNRLETLKSLEEALGQITLNIAYSQLYASMYTTAVGRGSMPAKLKAEMDSALPRFYAAVLVFSVKAKSYFHAAVFGDFPCGS